MDKKHKRDPVIKSKLATIPSKLNFEHRYLARKYPSTNIESVVRKSWRNTINALDRIDCEYNKQKVSIFKAYFKLMILDFSDKRLEADSYIRQKSK